MWHNTRRGRNIIKKRSTSRQNIEKNLMLASSILGIISLFVLTICIVKVNENTKIIDVNGYVDVAKEHKEESPIVPAIDIYEPVDNPKKQFELVALGEIMMGYSDITSYVLPFKEICEETNNADYAVATLSTNIANVDKIENAKSKYIVTSDILKGFNALGIDALNISTDHILDFGTNVLKKTINILKEANIQIIGRESEIIYAEHDGIRLAFIGVNNQIIGSITSYSNADIFVYNMNKIKSKIDEANKNADCVIMMTHLGLENTYKITEVMSWYSRALINAGADIVLGGHACGVYPIEIYKGKPIIYSMGHILSDTTTSLGRKSGVFKFIIDVQGNVTNIEVVPTYIYNKQVLIYSQYDKNGANDFMKHLASNISSYEIVGGKLNIQIGGQ